MFTQNANQWLHQVDPWSAREAIDLLQALERVTSVGVFDCAATNDGSRLFVMAPHAESVLLLPSAEAWQALVVEVAHRYGLQSTVSQCHGRCRDGNDEQLGWDASSEVRAVNDSKIMPLQSRA